MADTADLADVAGAPGPVQQPLRQGKRVTLRGVDRSDFEFLYGLASAPDSGFRWRYRGATPSPDLFAAQLWDGVLAQFMVLDRGSGERVGVVSLYNASFQNGHAYLAASAAPAYRSSGYMLDAALLFLDYTFTVWDLRKVYVETVEFNLPQFASGMGKFLVEEARLRDHEFFAGRHWDMVFLSIGRSSFDEYSPRYLNALAEGRTR